MHIDACNRDPSIAMAGIVRPVFGVCGHPFARIVVELARLKGMPSTLSSLITWIRAIPGRETTNPQALPAGSSQWAILDSNQ